MIYRNVLPVFLIASVLMLGNGCKQIKSGSSSLDVILAKAQRNIFVSQSMENPGRKKLLLDSALSQLNKADNIVKKKKKLNRNKVDTNFALYYAATGNLSKAKQAIASAKQAKPGDPYTAIVEVRITLQEKGKQYAAKAIPDIMKVLNKTQKKSLARLTLGDCNFLLSKYAMAVKFYQQVVVTSKDMQAIAADRLEYIDEIQKTRTSPIPFIKKLF